MSDGIEDVVKGWVAGDGACRAIVGTDVFDEVPPQGRSLAAGKGDVTVQVLSDVPLYGLSGATGLNTALVQVTGWAMDARTRRKLSDALRGLFESKALGDGHGIMRVAIEDSGFGSEPEGSGSGEHYRSARFDVGIDYRREPSPVGG